MFYNIIVNDIAPIFVIMMLGYAGAKIHAFTPDQTQALNKVVLDIALPAALFASITKANRELIFGDLLLTIISFAGQVGMFLLCFYICKKFWKHSIQQAAVCALITGAPTVGFLGFAVLDPVFGTSTQTGLVVAIEAILSNAVLIPIGFFLMNMGQPAAANGQQANSSIKAIINSLKQPVVWAPMLAVAIVLCGIRMPDALYPSLDLIAKANSGVAVFAAGLALATVKFSVGPEIIWNVFFRNFLSPLVVCLAGAFYHLPLESLSMMVLACALPPAFSGLIISSRYNIYVKDGASTLAVSTLVFAFSAPFWLWITPIVGKWF